MKLMWKASDKWNRKPNIMHSDKMIVLKMNYKNVTSGVFYESHYGTISILLKVGKIMPIMETLYSLPVLCVHSFASNCQPRRKMKNGCWNVDRHERMCQKCGRTRIASLVLLPMELKRARLK